MIYKCSKCGGELSADMTKECPTCFPATPTKTPGERVDFLMYSRPPGHPYEFGSPPYYEAGEAVAKRRHCGTVQYPVCIGPMTSEEARSIRESCSDEPKLYAGGARVPVFYPCDTLITAEDLLRLRDAIMTPAPSTGWWTL